jgi:CubicO group peptidase (beta-lactamase class C family)
MTYVHSNRQAELSRRRLLLLATTATGYGVLAATTGAHLARAATTAAVTASQTAAVTAGAQTDYPDFQELNAVIQDAMARYRVPGVAVGVIDGAREYTNGYGVTNVDAPVPVDAHTLFQTGSITKTYTATLVMRLVELGKLELDAPVRRYLPDLELADESVATQVTVRQLLNHSAGWFGDYFGPPPSKLEPTVPPWRGDHAIARYVANLRYLPQLAPLGAMFSYNNAAVVLAGRLVEAVTNTTYEAALTELVLDGSMRTCSRSRRSRAQWRRGTSREPMGCRRSTRPGCCRAPSTPPVGWCSR